MSEWLVLTIGLITYVSRAAALVFLPRPSPRVEEILARMPAPIFASLAVLTLIDADGGLAGGPVLLAALGGLALSLLAAPPAWAAAYQVTTTADSVDAAIGDGACADDSGACSLRAAVQDQRGPRCRHHPAGTRTDLHPHPGRSHRGCCRER